MKFNEWILSKIKPHKKLYQKIFLSKDFNYAITLEKENLKIKRNYK